MAERATISRHYQIRVLLIGLGALGMGLYFLYDGMVGYPAKQQVYHQFEQVRRQYTYHQLRQESPVAYQSRWAEVARQNDWEVEPPPERLTREEQAQYPDYNQRWQAIAQEQGYPERPEAISDTDILTQNIIAAILIPIGVVVLIRFLLNLRRWIEMDESGLRNQSGRRVQWGDIQSMDKSRWARKGIAVVHYANDSRQGRLVLDDWKYDREPVKRMVQRVDEQLGNQPDEPPAEPAPTDSTPTESA